MQGLMTLVGCWYCKLPIPLRARQLRKNETSAEWLFWQMIRNRKVKGFKFRRQHPLNKYITDFYCHEAKLVIELDGDIHLLEEIKAYDEVRENEIKELGLTVMRFNNEEIFAEAHKVIEKIEVYLDAL
jgi:very-short-patch-repair endonuclease